MFAGLRMPHIELPRALEDYFAFAETAPTRSGRRFSISMPYFDGARLDRLQWWYHFSKEHEERVGDAGILALREQATERFRRHIERWLENTRQRLYGNDPIPLIGAMNAPATAAPAIPAAAVADAAAPAADATTNVVPWPADKVANA